MPKDDYMNFVSSQVNPPTNATWECDEIVTGCAARSQLIMAIHQIEWLLDFKGDAIGDEMDGYLGTRDLQGIADVNAGLWAGTGAGYTIDHVERRDQQMVAAAATGNKEMIQPIIHKFDPPIAVAHSKLFLGGFTNGVLAQNVACRIGYTMRKVKTDEWLEALETFRQ